MKRLFTIAGIVALALSLQVETAHAQRGHDRSHDDDRKEYRERGGREQYRDRGRYDDRRNDRRYRDGVHRGPQQQRGRGDYYQGPQYGYQQRGNAYGRHKAPKWARAHRYQMDRHVYFPDYHTFYDARRGGYTYWGGRDWVFSQALPSFLVNVNLGRARVQVMGDVPMGASPYDYYGQYHRRYPAPQVIIPRIYIPRY